MRKRDAMMDELISREALVREVIGLTIVSPEVMNYANAVAVAIENAPIVDVEPVRHGRWAHGCYSTVWYGSGEPPEWICSLCHDRTYDTYDYCPNCGAKMDEEK